MVSSSGAAAAKLGIGEKEMVKPGRATKIRRDRHKFSLPDSRSLPQLNFVGGRITIAREANEVSWFGDLFLYLDDIVSGDCN